jgi:hypothetical protein
MPHTRSSSQARAVRGNSASYACSLGHRGVRAQQRSRRRLGHGLPPALTLLGTESAKPPQAVGELLELLRRRVRRACAGRYRASPIAYTECTRRKSHARRGRPACSVPIGASQGPPASDFVGYPLPVLGFVDRAFAPTPRGVRAACGLSYIDIFVGEFDGRREGHAIGHKRMVDAEVGFGQLLDL